MFGKQVQRRNTCCAKDPFTDDTVPMVFRTVGHTPGMEAAGEELEVIFLVTLMAP